MSFVDAQRAELAVVSFHEAGHAVIGTIVGLEVEYATTRISRQSRGLVRYTQATWQRLDVRLIAVCTMAGAAAVRRAFGPCVDPLEARDLAAAELLAPSIKNLSNPAAVDRAVQRASRRAERLVEGYWPWICSVAVELEQWRTLTGAEILALRGPKRKAA